MIPGDATSIENLRSSQLNHMLRERGFCRVRPEKIKPTTATVSSK